MYVGGLGALDILKVFNGLEIFNGLEMLDGLEVLDGLEILNTLEALGYPNVLLNNLNSLDMLILSACLMILVLRYVS